MRQMVNLSGMTDGWSILAADTVGKIELSHMVMVAMALLSVVLLLRSTRKRMQRSNIEPKARPQLRVAPEVIQARKVQRELEQTMLELDELSRQIHGRLDTKLARLELLLREADGRIDTLSRKASKPKVKSTFEVTLDQEVPYRLPSQALESEVEVKEEAEHEHAALYRYADQGMSVPEIAQRTGIPHGEVELILALCKTRDLGARASKRKTGS